MTIDEFFKSNKCVAVALSGGVDSVVVLFLAKKYADSVKAYFVKSQFQPAFELADAKSVCSDINAELEVINLDVLKCENIAANPKDRCYYCKKMMFDSIIEKAQNDGYSTVIDGTNASDDMNDRAGMKALNTLNILSPLMQCGIDKKAVRKIARENGLFVHNKPSYACLATRVPNGQIITKDILDKTEQAESILFNLGFKDFRIRYDRDSAKVQLTEKDMHLFFENREKITDMLSKYYDNVFLDLKARCSDE